MTLHFNQRQIDDWARLSGDYNPIHFDPVKAREAGLEDVVVHGMLALLHVKHQLSKGGLSQGAGQWTMLKSAFRHPVLRNAPYLLDVKAGGARSRFALRSEGGMAESISGSFSAVASPAPGAFVQQFSIDRAFFNEKKALFTEIFPEMDSAWLLVDAIAFSQFLSHEIPFSLIRDLDEIKGFSNQADLMNSALTMQTSHSVSIDPAFLSKNMKELGSPEEIRCELMPPVAVRDGSKSLTGLCQFNVIVDGKFLMQSEAGILIRFNS